MNATFRVRAWRARAVGLLAVLAMLFGVVAVAAPPASAVEPSVIVASGGGNSAQGSLTADVTVRPWRFFGKNLPIGGVNAQFSGWAASGGRTSWESTCLFGLGWNIAATDTPAPRVTFTCAEFGTQHINVGSPGEYSLPYLRVQTVTMVDGADRTGQLIMGSEVATGTVSVVFH